MCILFSKWRPCALGFSFLLYSVSPLLATEETKNLAEQKLGRIVARQEALFEALEADPDVYSEREQRRQLDRIFSDYRRYLIDNPEDVHAYILFGKLLRVAELYDEANQMFVRANMLDPKIAVVKQQIANYLAEKGSFGLSLAYFINAIQLEPDMALYHSQLGELLAAFKVGFVQEKLLTEPEVDEKLLGAFERAAKLAPGERKLQLRYAEAFYDVFNPDWEKVLEYWKVLEKTSPDRVDTEYLFLQQGRVLTEMAYYSEARRCLAKVFCKEWEKSRQELLQDIDVKRIGMDKIVSPIQTLNSSNNGSTDA